MGGKRLEMRCSKSRGALIDRPLIQIGQFSLQMTRSAVAKLPDPENQSFMSKLFMSKLMCSFHKGGLCIVGGAIAPSYLATRNRCETTTRSTCPVMLSVWQFYTLSKKDPKKAACNACGAEVSHGGHSTKDYNATNLIRHLRNHHAK